MYKRQFDELYALLEKKEGKTYPLLIKAGILKLFACLMEQSVPQKQTRKTETADRMKQVLSYIGDHYREALTLEELAGQCGLCQGHFCRMFRQYTLKNPVQYINTVRLDAAAQLLRTTDRKVLDIALDTGFNSVSYFTGVFRDYVGVTPTVYRKQMQQKEEGGN